MSIDEVIGFLKAAKLRGATCVAIDAAPMIGEGRPSDCDIPRVGEMGVIVDGDHKGEWIVVMCPEDLTR